MKPVIRYNLLGSERFWTRKNSKGTWIKYSDYKDLEKKYVAVLDSIVGRLIKESRENAT